MADALLEGLRVIGGPALAAAITWLGLRQSGRHKKIDAAQSLFNEVQEERAELKKDNARLVERIDRVESESKAKTEKLEADLRASYQRELIRDDFIQELRNHIRLEKGPPPPEWPESLRHG